MTYLTLFLLCWKPYPKFVSMTWYIKKTIQMGHESILIFLCKCIIFTCVDLCMCVRKVFERNNMGRTHGGKLYTKWNSMMLLLWRWQNNSFLHDISYKRINVININKLANLFHTFTLATLQLLSRTLIPWKKRKYNVNITSFGDSST